MPPIHPSLNPLRGIGLKILSVLVFTLMAICIKASAPRIPPGQAVFFRSLFAIPVILAWLSMSGRLPGNLATSNPLGHVFKICRHCVVWNHCWLSFVHHLSPFPPHIGHGL